LPNVFFFIYFFQLSHETKRIFSRLRKRFFLKKKKKKKKTGFFKHPFAALRLRSID